MLCAARQRVRSTDYGLLFHILPGYLPAKAALAHRPSGLHREIHPKTKEPKERELVVNRGKYITSYLKAIYGNKATKENDFGVCINFPNWTKA
jgi:formate dehydrogenase major subunit